MLLQNQEHVLDNLERVKRMPQNKYPQQSIEHEHTVT